VTRTALRVALAGLVALPGAARPAAAQGRMPHQFIFALGGAALGLGATALYSGRNYSRSLGWCSSVTCVGIWTTSLGTLLGYLIGHEQDEKYSLRYRLAPPVELANRSRNLRTRATGLDLGAGIVAVSGDDGVELVSAQPRLDYLGQRARGLRDILDVGVRPDTARLLIGTGTGLYLYDVAADSAGLRTLASATGAVAVREGRVAAAAGGAIHVGRLVGDSVAWASDTVVLTRRVTDLKWQNDSVLWALAETRLTAYVVAGDSAAHEVGAVDLTGLSRRLTITDSLAVIAAGAGGVFVVHVADPALPRIVSHWDKARYVYDVALWQGRIYAAAGPEGMYVLSFDGEHLQPIGVARDMGFVAALAAGDALYVLDRTGGVLRRIEAATP